MPQLLGALVLLIVGVPVVVFGAVWAARALGVGPPPPRELSPTSPEYRNHQGMARWIERQLHDDMVRVTISVDEQEQGRSLLSEFYDGR